MGRLGECTWVIAACALAVVLTGCSSTDDGDPGDDKVALQAEAVSEELEKAERALGECIQSETAALGSDELAYFDALEVGQMSFAENSVPEAAARACLDRTGQ